MKNITDTRCGIEKILLNLIIINDDNRTNITSGLNNAIIKRKLNN